MKAFIYLADGFEEIEALATCDVLRRAGIETVTVSVSDGLCAVGAHGISVAADCMLDGPDSLPANAGDVMIFPGGMPGAANLTSCPELVGAMKEHYGRGGRLAAICAAPGLVLAHLDIPAGTEFTCYDGFERYLTVKGAKFIPQPAVNSNRLITGRGPAYAIDFALEIVRELKGADAAASVRGGMFLN